VSRVVVLLLAALLVACSAPLPSATPNPVASVSPIPLRALAQPPPPAVQSALVGQARITFLPLTEQQQATVRITATEAERRALAEPGGGYGPDGGKVVWKKVGCVFLGSYTAPRMPNHGQPYVPDTYPAYLVQTLADPIPNFSMTNIGVAVIDATSGEWVSGYGAGNPPNGIMGTTCGVTP